MNGLFVDMSIIWSQQKVDHQSSRKLDRFINRDQKTIPQQLPIPDTLEYYPKKEKKCSFQNPFHLFHLI